MKKRWMIFVLACCLTAGITGSVVYAYLIDQKETVNQIRILENTTHIEEEFEPPDEVKPGQVIKKKPRGGNSPVIGDNGLMLEAGDNTKIMSINIALYNMQDIDMEDVSAVTQRLGEYFALYEKADLKPTVAGMAIALNGMSRQTLTAIAHDRPTGSAGYKTALPREVADSIKKAYKMLENMWETYMNSGKINPVSGIFLGKNNYGYQDKTEYVLTPNQQNDSDYDAEDIRQRYLIDSDSDSQSD